MPPWPAVPPCAVTWSTCPPVSPHRPASRCCTCPPIGHDKPNGKPCGTTSSATLPLNRAPPDPTGFSCPPCRPGPTRGTRNKEKLVQASRSRTRQPRFHLRLRPTNPATTARNHPSTESGLGSRRSPPSAHHLDRGWRGDCCAN